MANRGFGSVCPQAYEAFSLEEAPTFGRDSSLKKEAKISKCHGDKFQQSGGIFKENMHERDILLYFLCGTGLYTNR